ncbi:hypothetical protein ABW21_db0202403 [Orbilia brochopaga]|nr:hypothetical protein ABW21_db0202403 [Drechslerella brochopaga]
MQSSFKAMNKDLDCGNNIRKHYERLGLLNISHKKIDLRDCDSETKAMQNVNARIGLEEFITNAISRGPEALKRLGYESKETALARLRMIGSEGDTQAYFILHSILGQKPGTH